MYSIRIDKVINQMISFFYRIGFWHRGEEATTKELSIKAFYCVYQFLFTVSLAVGAITTEESDEFVFLAEISIAVFILSVKLWILMWKQKRILELLNRICVFSIRYNDDFTFVNKKLRRFLNFVVFASIALYATGLSEVVAVPLVANEKMLFFKITFPLDWKNSDIAYLIAYLFLATELFLTITAFLFNGIMWYLILNCSLRYQVLASELKKMGQTRQTKNKNISEKAKQVLFFEDLQAAIDNNLHIRKLISDLESFFSKLFLLQIGTSALATGGSIYCLAFGIGKNFIETGIHCVALIYSIADIFSITYFGNEIMLSSDSLSNCFFESNWIEQPQLTKKCIIIFGEHLMQPKTIIVGKLYPLTLETFKRILHSAYSMFNILQKFK